MTSFLFGLRRALLYLFPRSPGLNPSPGSSGRNQAFLFSSPNIILPSDRWIMADPELQSSLLSSCESELKPRVSLICATEKTKQWQQDGCDPPLRKWVESQHSPPSWHPGQMELANAAAQPQPKPWQQCARGNRKRAKPIRAGRALPSK